MKYIKLDNNHVGKYTNGKEILNICDEDLEFQIDYNFNKNAEVYFVADNGIIMRKGRINNNKFVLPCSFLNIGRLKLKIIVSSLERNEEFSIEDLIVMAENGEFKAIPEIVKMNETIENYSKIINSLERKCQILTKLVGGLYDTDMKEGEGNE